MEEIREQTEIEEVVLTYRSADQVEPVQLTYTRPLPQGMARQTEDRETGPAAPWRSAIAPAEKKRGRWGVRLFVALSLLVGLVCLGLGIWYVQTSDRNQPAEEFTPNTMPPFYQWEPEQEEVPPETTIRRYRPFGGSIIQLELTPAGEDAQVLSAGEVYEKLLPSVVTVVGRRASAASVGTGVIFSADGYILTNSHVIEGCSACEIRVTDQYGVDWSYDAMLVGNDQEQDLAVLKIDGEGLIPAQFGVSSDLSVGDKVYAIGNPLGLELRGTLTDGIISAIDRDVLVDGISMTLLQTNAALNSGNSGGPLINEYGQVVGINTIKMMSGYDTIEGLGFAIPTSLAVKWVNEMIRYGEILPQPVLGVEINRIPQTLPDGTTGLQVSKVNPGGSGEKAGVQVGDYVVAFDGKTVTRTEHILAIRRTLSVGDVVVIRVWRDGEYLDLEMEMLAKNREETP